MKNRIVGWTVSTLVVLGGSMFALVGVSFFIVGDFEQGGLAVALVTLVLGLACLLRGAMVGAVRIDGGVRVRNVERTYTIHKGATVRKEAYLHGSSAFLFTSPVITLEDGQELDATGLKVFAFMDKRTHTTDRNVAKIAAWLAPDGSTTSSG